MKDIKSFNGKRLKTARTLKRMQVSELADAIGVQRQTINMYESGKLDNPGFDKIMEMSRTLSFPIDYFLEADNDLIQTSASVYFRSLLTTRKRYREEQESKINFVSTIFAFLCEYVSFPDLKLPSVDSTDDYEDIAMKLRECWKLGNGPIDNLVYHAEKHGIIITSFSTDTNDIDAFSQRVEINHEERYVVAFSNNKNTAARIHFDVAHELGHILLHDWNEDLDELSPEEFKQREQEANSFASAFLLPRDSFIKEIGQYADKLNYYIELKKKWKVSVAAMIRRAKDLDLIDYDQYQSLMRQMQKNGIRKKEPLDDVLITAQPTLLKAAVEMLLNNDVLSSREIMAELSNEYNLSLYPSLIEELLGLKEGTLAISNVIPMIGLTLKNRNEA